jgi:hypothetical protein
MGTDYDEALEKYFGQSDNDRVEDALAEGDRYREALEDIAMWAEHGYQDLNSGGVLSCVKKRAKQALDPS